jgi:putative flippase GtrA
MIMMTRLFDVLTRLTPTRLHRHREEGERIARFVLIGGLSFAFNYIVYILLSRVLWPNGDRTLENFLAVVITSVLNYLAHRRWTFRSKGAHTTQITRYIFVAVSAILLQSCLFWIGYHLFHAPDLLVIFVVGIMIPFYTYLAHKLFTFRETRVISS